MNGVVKPSTPGIGDIQRLEKENHDLKKNVSQLHDHVSKLVGRLEELEEWRRREGRERDSRHQPKENAGSISLTGDWKRDIVNLFHQITTNPRYRWILIVVWPVLLNLLLFLLRRLRRK